MTDLGAVVQGGNPLRVAVHARVCHDGQVVWPGRRQPSVARMQKPMPL